ncbi:Bacitracin resistance protein BacA [Ferroglobus placidus DSM 10642]|uniref:Undecaprenyl-diphosphatase n=1 Tax=Ferroglobus placidus (strain DSM 10642 / AEDII12DO) TaxID=589924 RepID=D3S004_FERPA|nr:undecaprenyl-diphosphate phosphatase [Ferroglobus placidus]ADC66067.1 Bacitracin resistance protein BacA [Ferroglobus placidus DSM 10642]
MSNINNFTVIMLAIIQGVAEWLPVSSEGLSILLMVNILKVNFSEAFSYAIFLHLGTMLAVLAKFRRDFLDLLSIRSPILKQVLLATIFTASSAVPLMLLVRGVDGTLANMLIGFLLIATGILLRLPKEGYKKAESLSLKESAALGFVQGFAILPGISRSGATISFLLLRKVKEEDALKLSFIISVPAVAGAVLLSGFPKNFSIDVALTLTLTTFLVGYGMIDLLLKFASKVSFSSFCMALGVTAVALTFIVL